MCFERKTWRKGWAAFSPSYGAQEKEVNRLA